MPRMRLIVNPASDRGHTKKKEPRIHEVVAEAARQAGADYEIDWVDTERRLHATELARQAAEAGYDMVVAAGGDGTVHEVANGLLQADQASRPPMGIIPVGSGNDFAYNVGVPIDLQESASVVFQNHTRTFDAATISDATGRTEFWNNTVGIGFAGAVNVASSAKPRLRGFLLYLVAVIESIVLTPQEFNATVRVDGGEPIERYMSMISIAKGPREGGGFPTVPQAIMDDGYLHYVLMRRVNRLQMFYFLPVVMAAKHLGYEKFFDPGTAKEMTIETDKAMAIHIDGELFAHWDRDVREISVKVLPAQLTVICPPAEDRPGS